VNLVALTVFLTTALPPAPLTPLEACRRVEELWQRRDEPAVMIEAKQILAEEKARHGKMGWDLAERAVARNPNDAAGHFWAAVTMGNYSLGLGIVRAIAQGIEGKFRRHIAEAERLDPRYGKGAIQNAWGGYYLSLPWPKRDVKKAAEYLGKALVINPHNLRTRVFLAQVELREDHPIEAKRLLDEVLAATPGKYDPPEEKRAKILAGETMRKVVDAMK
jgi:tetratricopeptide (TPR) repeat protein